MLNRISLLLVLASRQRSKDRDRASAFQRFAGHFRAVPVTVLSDTKPEISGEKPGGVAAGCTLIRFATPDQAGEMQRWIDESGIESLSHL